MDFYEVLEQVVSLLRRRGRVTYRALKRQFDLDDDVLEDLKEELFYSQSQVIDDDGKGLIWAGESGTQLAPSSTPSVQPDVIQQDHTPQPKSPLPEPSTPDAERRQLTVMFCDLADSTRLSNQLDPEDLRDVIRAYQSTSAEVIERYDGYIAQHLGDGLMVYFGWPQAHEDDARRAVHTGLGILEAMRGLNARLEQEKGVHLAVRIGIHTGLVVIGEIGRGSSQEHLALGETPNIASRIESIASPDTLAISATTHRLMQGYFVCQDLGHYRLKGIGEPQQLYRVIQASEAQSRIEVAASQGLTPVVGRDEEIDLLLRRWEQAKEGEGQVVLLSGEAGIGKSRITQALRERLADEPHIRLHIQCLPYYANSAFYPIITHLERAMSCERDAPPDVKLDALETLLAEAGMPLEDAAPLFAAMLSIPTGDRYVPLALSPQRQKDKTIEAVVDQIQGLSQQHPILFAFEDLHWIDPTSLEVVDSMIARLHNARVLLVITYRPEFVPAWSGFTHITAHTLNRLSRQQVAAMVERVSGGKALPPEVMDQIVAKTDGVPLFVEELTKTVLESGLLTDDGEQYRLAASPMSLAIPDTLQGSLMARLDRLADVKEIAQVGAAIGREFSYQLLAAVSTLPDVELQAALHQLAQTELVFRRGQPAEATYVFKHALVQDAAYSSLLRSTRQQLHTQIATAMEAHFPSRVESEPETVAHHYTEAGHNAQAVVYWQRAARHASGRSAHIEAISHCNKGLALLSSLPDTPERAQQELTLQTMLGPALMNVKGQAAPEVEHAYARARALCQQIGDTPEGFPVLFGLWYNYLVQAQLPTARELVEQLVSLAQSTQDRALILAAHRALGQNLSFMGELQAAREHLEQALALYDREQDPPLAMLYGQDLAVICHAWLGLVLWLLGYPDQALRAGQAACVLADDLAHPYSQCYALNWTAMLHIYRRDGQMVQTQAEALVTLSKAQAYAVWVASGAIWQGWAQAEAAYRAGKTEADAANIARMQQGLAAWLATGSRVFQPYYLALLGEAYGNAGHTSQGLTVLTEALVIVERTEERYYEAELHRLKGELLLRLSSDNAMQAATCFQQALSVARRQVAKSLQLRAATSLARLWQQQDKRQAAYDLLAPVYEWFTEGFDTADLQDARALLQELGE